MRHLNDGFEITQGPQINEIYLEDWEWMIFHQNVPSFAEQLEQHGVFRINTTIFIWWLERDQVTDELAELYHDAQAALKRGYYTLIIYAP